MLNHKYDIYYPALTIKIYDNKLASEKTNDNYHDAE